MKKKTLLQFLVIAGILGFAGVGVVSAHGGFGWMGTFDPEKFVERQQEMFQKQADILGIGIDKVKNYWSEGKTLKEMSQAEGIADDELLEKMKAAREENMKQMMQSLVEKGIITQQQADKRLEIMKERTSKGKFRHNMRAYMMKGW